MFQKSWIIVRPSYKEVNEHKHPLLHVFLGKGLCSIFAMGEQKTGSVIIIDGNTEHILLPNYNCELFLLIDPTSIVAERIRNKYLQGQSVAVLQDESLCLDQSAEDMNETELAAAVIELFHKLQIDTNHVRSVDSRILDIMSRIQSGEYLQLSVKEIANRIFLSESRLIHLFSQEAGVSLKSYILIKRTEYAYRLIMGGESITKASLEAGFNSSAHLAASCKKLTGISISDALKK